MMTVDFDMTKVLTKIENECLAEFAAGDLDRKGKVEVLLKKCTAEGVGYRGFTYLENRLTKGDV